MSFIKNWWRRMFGRPPKPTRGLELLEQARSREHRVERVHQDLSAYKNRNHIAEQLKLVFENRRHT